MTAVLDTPDTTVTDAAPLPPLASWPARLGAFAIDVLLLVAVVVTVALVASTRWWWEPVALVAAGLTIAVLVATRSLLASITGWTLGRALFGIAVCKPDGSRAGFWRLLSRDVAHLLDTGALFIGWLWPLWDRRNRTFADLLLRTEVQTVEPPKRDMRRLAAVVLIAAAVLCAAAVGVGYFVGYRHQQAVDTARQQITEQGPRIVEQMLSYSKETLQQDFSHAQSLTTDGYRPQLIAQQQAVQQAGATSNEYWAVSSAVLPMPEPTPTHASMLLAMQGQRGSNPNDLKFITATVRVDFEKSRDGKWQVASLTVLKKPLMNTRGQ
ncbi:MAG: Mce-associated rane protein [Mycobacterium sp.]|nr:Mce-associated rane protein [Mycobacterium sp.]